MKNKEKWLKRQQELVDAARAAGRGMTAEEQAEFDELQRKIDTEPDTPDGGEPTDGQRGAGSVPVQPANPEAVKQAEEAERQRSCDIIALCRQTGMDPAEYIKSGATLDAVRTAALEHVLQHGAPVVVGARDSGTDNFRDAARDAMLIQAGVDLDKPAQGAEEMRGMSLRDMLIECMARSGEGTVTELLRRSRADLWDTAVRQFFSSTADFPAILDNAIKKSIVQQYELVPATFEAWTSRGTLTDFKPSKAHEYAMGGGNFQKVTEGGEIKASKLTTELLPTRKLDTYATQFSMTREAFINDDIGFLANMPAQYSRKAKQKINRQVYERLYTNPAIFDGVAMFDAAHRNLIEEGSAPSVKVLELMIQMMGMQVDQFGESILVEPATIIVPMGWGMRVNQIMGTAQLDVEGIGSHTVNVLNTEYKNKIKVIQEPVLNMLAKDKPCPWFMAADPKLVKSEQVDYLNGNTAPSFRRSEKAGYLGFLWDIWLDYGINDVDFRGILRNNGVPMGQ